ncbi:MAG TPA: undecaprenyl-diphosphate phosphatase [Firmicutes bacterium]|nr:undecaprenyl-diphosphate phosphatase [Bacillota bacterium]
MSALQAIFLGIVQGLTEFLPVSSSGHLVLFSQLMEIKETSLVFEIVVHGGTLLAVLLVLRADVILLIRSFFKLLKQPKRLSELIKEDPGCRLLANLVYATLPVVILALIFKEQIENLFLQSIFVGFMLIITGTVLFISERLAAGPKKLGNLKLPDAAAIGLAQAVAVLPGISRSGSTIAMGRARGLARADAARFSFLLSIPAILGALVFSLKDLTKGAAHIPAGSLWLGFIAAAVTGYGAIHLLLNLIKQRKLIWFAYYTWVVGAAVVLLSLI